MAANKENAENLILNPPCEHCDEPGGPKTYKHQVCMPIKGKVVCIDRCIHQMVASLNAGNVGTVASCCGHQKMPGMIILEDGRVLLIFAKYDDVDWDVWRQSSSRASNSV